MLPFIAALAFAQAPTKAPEVTITPIKVLEGLRPLAFAAAPTGSKFAVSLEDNSIRIIDASTRQTLKTLTGHPQPCYGLAWSKDGALLASGDETARVWLWETKSWQKIKEFRNHIRGIQKLSFDASHGLLISTGKDDVINVYDVKKGVVKHSILGHGDNFYGATFDPTSEQLTTGFLGAGARTYLPDGTVKGELDGHDGLGVFDVDYNSTGTRIATGGRDNNVILWDAKKRQKIQTLHGHSDWVNNVRFSPNGRYLASGSTDHSVRVWDTVLLKPVTILNDQCAIGSPLCWTSDGKYLITVNLDDYLQVNSVVPAQAGKEKPARKTVHRRRRRH